MTIGSKINALTVFAILAAYFMAEICELGIVSAGLMLIVGISLMCFRCQKCGHFLWFWGRFTVLPWMPRRCQKCGEYDPLSRSKKERE